MKTNKVINFICSNAQLFVTVIILIVFSILTISFTITDRNTAPQKLESYAETGSDGSEIYAVSVEDIGEINRVKALNYVDGEFTQTAGYVSNSGTGTASRGTIKILLKNLDPTDEDFIGKAYNLNRFADGNYWKITMYIPAVFSACNIYVDGTLTAQIGAIEGYNFEDYGEKHFITETYTTNTEPTFLTLSLYNVRSELTGDAVSDGCVVTIHYESKSNVTGVLGNIFIGEESAVKSYANGNSAIHFPLAACGILVFALFIFICILKKTFNFLPPMLLAFGIFIFQACCYYLTVTCPTPIATLFFKGIGTGVIALSAAGSCKLKFKKFDMRMLAIPLAVLCLILEMVYPFNVSYALENITRAIYVVLAVIVIAVQLIKAAAKIEAVNGLSATASAVFTLYMALALDPSNFFSPSNWLCVAMLILIMCIGCGVFVKMERESKSYTENLQKEVAAQTNSLQTMLNEKEDMLRFVSHDMRKPVKSIDSFLATLSARETDKENQKTVAILQNKTQELGRLLDELSQFSKVNFIAEPSEHIELAEVTDKIFNLLSPDCSANGIVFSYKPCKIKVFAKRKSLESILTNIVMNAIEHSGCTEIALAVERRRKKCVITISDNGRGIKDDAQLFSAYEGDNGTHGLGLYICRRYADSMNATVTYDRLPDKTVFSLVLPLA